MGRSRAAIAHGHLPNQVARFRHEQEIALEVLRYLPHLVNNDSMPLKQLFAPMGDKPEPPIPRIIGMLIESAVRPAAIPENLPQRLPIFLPLFFPLGSVIAGLPALGGPRPDFLYLFPLAGIIGCQLLGGQ